MPGWGGEFEELIVKSFQRSTHVLWLVRYGPYVVFFFHFSRDGLRQKKGLFIAYTMYPILVAYHASVPRSYRSPVCLFVCFIFFFFFIRHQSMRTVPSCTNLAKQSMVFIKSTRMVLDLTLKFATKNLLAGDGQWPRRS